MTKIDDSKQKYEVLYSNEGLSFWGGVDPTTGIIIDQMHPLCGQSVADKVLCIPSGRGSCTGSQVVLELILNGRGPRAIILRDIDTILCTGAIIAEEFFYYDGSSTASSTVPPIYAVGKELFQLFDRCSYLRIQDSHDFTSTIHLMNDENDPNPVTISATNLLEQSNKVNDIHSSSPSSTLNLTPVELSILHPSNDNTPPAHTAAMRTIVRIALITSAPNLLPIQSAHIDGCTFIGQGGLSFVRRLVELNGKVSVPTTLNSVSADRRRWEHLGVDPALAQNANAVGDAYLKLGCNLSFTCAPYLLPSKPGFGVNVVWGESNAVVFANSVLGARTDKYADYLDICAALVGRVPNVGVHQDNNRMPGIILDATELVKDVVRLVGETEEAVMGDLDAFFPTMGWLCGYLSDGRVPLILGLDRLQPVTTDDLKAFCAAFGTTGTAPLFHMAGVTPECLGSATLEKMMASCGMKDTKVLSMDDLRFAFESLDSGSRTQTGSPTAANVDLVALGNPHLSITELERLVKLTRSRNGSPLKRPEVKVMATLSRHVQGEGEKLGYIKILQDFGIDFVNDTCWCMMVEPPIIPVGVDATIMTNSGKYAHYGPGLTNRRIRFGSMAQCMNIASGGQLFGGSGRSHRPSWLSSTRSFVSIVKRVLI